MKNKAATPWSTALANALASLCLFACAPEEDAGPSNISATMQQIQGTLELPPEVQLPENAIAQVALVDVSKMDVPHTVIVQDMWPLKDASPLKFALSYEPESLQDRNWYRLNARIESDSRLLLRGTLPFTKEHSDEWIVPLEYVAKPDAPLVNTRWKTILIEGEPVNIGQGGRELHVTLFAKDNRVSGSSGCNNFTGSYTLEEGSLNFGQMAGTRMACSPEISKQEDRFLNALSRVRNYQIKGDKIDFLDTSGNSLLHCEALYLQ